MNQITIIIEDILLRSRIYIVLISAYGKAQPTETKKLLVELLYLIVASPLDAQGCRVNDGLTINRLLVHPVIDAH